jgi:hypothetical protein
MIEHNGHSNNNNNSNPNGHEEVDPASPTLVFRIQNDEEDNLYYFEYRRYSILDLNWRSPWEIEVIMRIEHYDTPRSKLKLNKVTDKLYRALKAAQCPDLINEELANKINNLSIKKPELRTFVQNLRSHTLIQEMSREELSVEQEKHKKPIVAAQPRMEVAEDVPERLKSPTKPASTTLRNYGIEDVYTSVDDLLDDGNHPISAVSPTKPITSPYKPNVSDGSSRPPVNPIVISPDKLNGNAPAPAAARELFGKTPPRPSSPVNRTTPTTRAPAAITGARKTPRQAAKKAPLEKIVGDKRKKLNSPEESPAAKKRRLTPKQALKNVEEVAKAQKLAMEATFPINLQAAAIFIENDPYTLVSVKLLEEKLVVECEDDDLNYDIGIPYHFIQNMEVTGDEEIKFSAKVEMLDAVKDRDFLIIGHNFKRVESIIMTKIFDRN